MIIVPSADRARPSVENDRGSTAAIHAGRNYASRAMLQLFQHTWLLNNQKKCLPHVLWMLLHLCAELEAVDRSADDDVC
jgi:hypothetical protein